MRIKHGDKVHLFYMADMVGTLFCPKEIGLRSPAQYYIKVDKDSKRQGWYPDAPGYRDFPQDYTYWAVDKNSVTKLGPETFKEIFLRELMS